MKFDLLRAVPSRLTIAEASRSPDARPVRRGFRHDGESSPLARWLAISLLPLAALALSTGAHAADGMLTVKANVPASCTVNSPELNFGNYSSGQAGPVTAQADIVVTCTNSTSVTIKLSGGNDLGAFRRMVGPSGITMEYDLYQDIGFGTIWGDPGIHGSAKIITTNGSPATHTIFGRINGGQTNLPGGQYMDMVEINLVVD